ncbi:MAG: thiamine phosphate synthase, partial [Phycisphaerales bacterium]|nr:thiamine phosphate synthase [Phycisphaerales bacterium]
IALATARLPLFAIGGITADNLPALIEAGCTRIAVSSAILGAASPTGAAHALRRLPP